MSFIFGGGGSAPQTTTGTQTVTQREAPGVEARKLSLYDQAAKLAASPVNLPAIQVAGLSPAEQQAITAARTGGAGAGTVGAGISAIQSGLQAPNINQFLNPFQSFVTDEIARRGQMQMNEIAAKAVGGNSQEAEAAVMSLVDEFGSLSVVSAGVSTQLGLITGQFGLSGANQRGIGQAQLDAQRQTALQRSFEPFQRIEFLKGIMTNLPTTSSTLTQTTAPGANPVGQALGAGLGAYSAYNLMQPR